MWLVYQLPNVDANEFNLKLESLLDMASNEEDSRHFIL